MKSTGVVSAALMCRDSVAAAAVFMATLMILGISFR
jgi:hypothetical protein